MIALVLIASCVAFVAGVLLATWRLPRLSDTPLGNLCFGTSRCLLGAAAAAATATVWSTARALELISSGGSAQDAPVSSTQADVILGGVSDLATRVGLLVALAALVYVLGPPDRRT